MARGRTNKLRKAERESKQGAATIGIPPITSRRTSGRLNTPSGLRLDRDPHPDDHRIDCDHRNISSSRLRRVSLLLKEVFLAAFDTAASSNLREIPKRIEDHMTREQFIELADVDFDLQLIKEMADNASLKEELKGCIKQFCESDFGGDLILQGTDDCFDALCNIGASHGHDFGTLGPPCACSFTHCMSCLEHLVTVWKEVQVTPPPIEVVHLKESKVVTMMESLADEDWMDSGIILEGLPYKTEITDALNKMRDTLWEAAGELEATHIRTWKVSREFISGLTGLELYYTVAMRELIAAGPPPTIGPSAPSVELHRKRDVPVPSLREQHTQLKKDLDRLLKADEKKRPALEAMSIGYRRILARHFRDLGNTAYTMSDYVIANGLYTRAIKYDAEDPIYPLNRAACRIKLKCFSSAETDCSSALSMDPSNYKAFFRRGVSKVGQGRYEQAKRDFEEVLKLQKHNPAALKELKELEAKRLAGQRGQVKTDSSRLPAKKSPTTTCKLGKGQVGKAPAAVPAPPVVDAGECKTAPDKTLVETPGAEQRQQSDSQTPRREEGSLPAKQAAPESGKSAGLVLETTLVCSDTACVVEEVFLPASSCLDPFDALAEVPDADSLGDAPADKPEEMQSNEGLTLPALPALSKSPTTLLASDISDDADEAEDYRAHAARVAKLLDGLQHCKANMDSADAATRKEAIASASQLVKEFEATESETQALTQKVVKRTQQLSSATAIAKASRIRPHRSAAHNRVKPKPEQKDPDAPGASETSEQRKVRLDKETRDQLFFTWAFIHIVQQRTGALILKSQRHRPEGILAIDTLNGTVAEPSRRGSDSGIERSPVAKARKKLRAKGKGAEM
ncbi:hypothetical protein BCV69DRAFT_281290 [Microstroma glucosiphilum]|uniref:Uncharacterized protein n=1 Tax=Pseudomicrostroma glucosiphilum TaxID=1684307 RepID=A0A316UAQ0_9BASI|nr:hypothetical protein BCV69DRAFT_281290 [Pseudomicrostroma glucosiphilum]PWN22287.1 hypothetical protein BCV69DRAFT_281290 [Pseudomicrostroma glucosiphilum]